VTQGDRSSHFPAIEKKHGKPMSHWHRVMKRVADGKYDEQMALLMGEHGFSRTHANALVMWTRGSTTSRRHSDVEGYLATVDEVAAATMRRIFAALRREFPRVQTVMAWNQPMLKHGDRYVFGASVSARHITIAPWDAGVLVTLAPRLVGYHVNKKTVRVPVDWKVDRALLRDMVAPQMRP
jgi:uncharacterized protein YdhG (YjbR/CyaY superfamily)